VSAIELIFVNATTSDAASTATTSGGAIRCGGAVVVRSGTELA
jgi:predicted outer membrane repeat protein